MARELRFTAIESAGELSALLELPADARVLYVLAHGAGGGMRGELLEQISHRLAARGVGTFRYQFPYVEQGRLRTDPPAIAQKTVRSAVEAAISAVAEDGISLPLIAGGKSFGGRMTAYAAARKPLSEVRGLAFLGFPLHPPRHPSTKRWEPMPQVRLPMLFLQGTRDELAELDLLRPLIGELDPPATLHVVEGADHSFKVPRSSGRTSAQVIDELADVLATWARGVAELGQKRLFG